jgi:hypothetical protein
MGEAMRLVWTIKLYESKGALVPFKVRVEGYAPDDYGGRVHSNSGRGKTPEEALQACIAPMAIKPWLAK